jgi:hypothetical protein
MNEALLALHVAVGLFAYAAPVMKTGANDNEQLLQFDDGIMSLL